MFHRATAARIAASFALMFGLVFVPALAGAQSSAQKTCITSMNKAGSKVVGTQGKENSGCVKAAGSGKLEPGQDTDVCISADNKGKVVKATGKTTDTQASKCVGTPPPYGFGGASATNTAGVNEEKALVQAIFGNPVDPAMMTTSPGNGCQSSVAKAYEKLAATRMKEIASCKTSGFKLGTISNAVTLGNCLSADPKSKVSNARGKLNDAVTDKCVGVSLSTAFPGCSAESATPGDLANCIARNSECHMCLAFEAMDAIDVNCDQFDDGNVNQTCRQCLNGATEAPEQCDDGAESLTCDTDCTFASCGDSHVNATRGETCDQGGETATCDDDCTAPVCTDGNLNTAAGEVCDDGNNVNGDGCDNNCKVTACGNGIVTAGETCDDGNNTNGDGCDNNCKPTGCGNGVVTSGETCDDGNLVSGDGCDANCKPTGCPNGIVTGTETCDDGNNTNGDGCDNNCKPTGCGNGVVTSGETCDDGNLVSGDGCDANCTPTGCGNGIVTAGEFCDSSGVNTAVCDSDCTAVSCHDGHLNPANGEACDDGNVANTDSCVGTCVLATCGDGFICGSVGCTTGPSGGVEQCDNDGSNSNVTPNACRTNCKLPSCGDNVTDAGEFCDTGGNSPTCDANCSAVACGDGFLNTAAGEQCDPGSETPTCDADCTTRACGDGYQNVAAGEECDDGNTTSGDGCSATCKCLAGSGEIGCQAAACPNKGQLTLLAATTGTACTTNGDCVAGTCDTGLGVCVTQSELDTGWTGISHDSDVNDNTPVMGRLLCPGPGPTCGQCTVVGLMPDFQNCRCRNNNRTVCNKPFAADATNCGVSNNTCDCYFGAPLPLSAGNTPACAVNRFAVNISGTANVDTGAGLINANLKSSVYLGESTINPCPSCGGTCTAPPAKVGLGCGVDPDCDTSGGSGDGVCGNYDPTPGDGLRGGKCYKGDNDGLSCDIMAPNRTFPAPGGGGSSLDCFPASGKNVSGTGLTINLAQTTGTSSLPAAALSCNFGFGLCPCGQCTGDTTVGCTANADCTAASVSGPCVTASERPNGCDDGVCTASGGGEGQCLANLQDRFCDGIVRANGEGFVGCQANADCLPVNIGTNGGNCTLSKTRECFLDPITATGVQNASKPLGVASFCVPKTANGGINSVAGLPGPGRIKSQAVSKLFCANNPLNLYTPGFGCP